MTGSRTVYYNTEYNEETKVYTSYCPSMKPVRFSGKDQETVQKLAEDGICVYLKKYPDFFESFKDFKVYLTCR